MLKFVPFGNWSPDAPEYGEPLLKKAENVLPAYGSHRPVRQKSQVASVANGPVTGAHVHFFQKVVTNQFARPDADDSVGSWVTDTGAVTNLFQRVDEDSASDADYIQSNPTPTSSQVKLRLSDVTDPTSATDHIYRWRYKIVDSDGGAWTVVAELMQGTTVIATDTATGTDDVDWTQRSDTLSAGEANSITDYTNLFVRFTATVAGSTQFGRPISDVAVGSWTTDAGGSSSLFQQLDETSSSDADFVQSPALTAGGVTYTYTAGLTSLTDPGTDSGLVWRYRYKATNAGVTIVARLKQGTTTIKEVTHASAATSFTQNNVTLSTAEAAAITDFTTLRAEFAASYPSAVASTASQFLRPDSDFNIFGVAGTWLNSAGGSTNLYAEIDESSASDADYIDYKWADASPPSPVSLAHYVATLSDVTDPLSDSGHVLRARWRKQGAASVADITVRLHQSYDTSAVDSHIRGDATVVASMNDTTTNNDWRNLSYTLSSAEAAAITDYNDLHLQIAPTSLTSANKFLESWAELEVPEVRRAVISWTELELPSPAAARVSWFEFELPDLQTTYKGDSPIYHAGTDDTLYTFDSSGFTDVSIAGGYATGTNNPTAWSMASWGDDVIATNYVDPVQVRTAGAGLFADLITSSDKPKARFVTVVKNHVMLGDINFSGHAADEVWWSAVDDAADFQKSATTLADFQRLRHVPGQVMGLVGGEYAIVFKRNSILRMNFVGAPAVFDVNVLSTNIGTPFPKSVVPVGNDIYFRSAGNFYVMRGGGAAIETVGDKDIAKFLGDPAFSTEAIAQAEIVDTRTEDQLISGAYNPFMDSIVWSYQNAGDTSTYRHRYALIYNIREDRWGYILDENLNLALLLSRPNILTTDTFLLKGIIGLDWDGTDTAWFQWSGTNTYEATLQTKIVTLYSSEGEGKPKNCYLRAVRPVFSVNTTTTWPTLTIAADASNDVRMVDGVKSSSNATPNSERFYPFNLQGEFWRFTVTVPTASTSILKELVGLQCEFRVEGEK